VINSGVVNVMALTEWVDENGARWGFKDGPVSAALAAQDWLARFEQWSKHSLPFGVDAAKYWSFRRGVFTGFFSVRRCSVPAASSASDGEAAQCVA
jgi:hypothetical protein